MSDGEHTLADTRGRVLRAATNGRALTDAEWRPGRVVLSNRRLVFATNEGKTTIPLAHVDDLGGRQDVNQAAASVPDYVRLAFDDDVVLIAAGDSSELEEALYRALLDGEFMVVRHPAVEGGVIRETDWERCRLSIEPDRVGIAVASGSFVEIALDDVGGVSTTTRDVGGELQTVIEIEHADGTTSVQTNVAGSDRHCEFLDAMLREGAERNRAELDLDGAEQRILTALYSGVSPFAVPEFLDLDVDEVEAVYERLVELDVLDEVRVRREVALTTRGRNLASDAIDDNR